VKVLGSYTDTNHIAYLMLPVAQGNLDDFLRKPDGLADSDKHDIRSFFGCLAGAANYLHRSRIRHRDLSLKNILVHDGSVFISDFGSAYKWARTNNQGSMTQHHNVPATRFYMAPEIARNSARNSSSDMWSLGVIFLEMTTLLVGRTLTQLQSKLSDNLRQNIEPYLWANPRVVTDWLQILQEANQGPAHDNEPLEWIRDLLHPTPRNRPTSGALMESIHDTQSFHIFCCIDCQSEFRDRRFKDNDSQSVEEENPGDATDIMQNVAYILEEAQQPVLMSSQTHSTIQSWLADTEVSAPNVVVPDIEVPDHVLPSRMPGEFETDDDGEETDPIESDIGSSGDQTTQSLVVDSIIAQSMPAIVAPSTSEKHKSPVQSHLGHSQIFSLSTSLEHAKDTGYGFFEIDSPSSSDDGIREISDSSGSDAGSDGTIKQPLRIEYAFGGYCEDRRYSVLERPHFVGDVDKPLQVLDSLDPILEVSDDSDDDGTGLMTQNDQIQTVLPRPDSILEVSDDSDDNGTGSMTQNDQVQTVLPRPTLDCTVPSVDDVRVDKQDTMHPEAEISTLVKPSELIGVVNQNSRETDDGDMQVDLNITEEDVVEAEATPANSVRTKKIQQRVQSVGSPAKSRNTRKISGDPIHPTASGEDLVSESASDHLTIRHEKNSRKKRSAPAVQTRSDSAVANSEDQEGTERSQAALRKQHPQPWQLAEEDGTNHTVIAPHQKKPSDHAEGLADQPPLIVNSKPQEKEDLCSQPAAEELKLGGNITVKSKNIKKAIAASIQDQTPTPHPEPVTGPSKSADDDWKWSTVERDLQTPLIEEKTTSKAKKAVSHAEVPADDQTPLDEAISREKKTKTKRKSSRHVTFAEDATASPVPLVKEDKSLKLEIDPSAYIRDTWETASSVATSTMSDRTKRMLQGFSMPRWWDHDHNLLEVFCSQGKAQAVRALLDKGCNPGKAGPKGKRRSGPITVAIKGASLRHNRCVKALIEAEADVNVVNHSTGKTPLHLAIENPKFKGYEHLICALIDGGANPNLADIRGDRPITKILLENGNGPLEEHHQKALALLLRDKATDVEVTQPGTLNTPLHLAVRRKDPFTVAMLLFKKANINAKNAAGSTPLLVAANQLHKPTTKEQKQLMSILLHVEGILVNEKAGVKEQTALHYAVNAGVSWAVDMLLEHAADPACEDKEGRNALKLAQIHAEDVNWSSEDREGILSRLRRASVKEKSRKERDGDAGQPKRAKKKSART
jgi:serine/threonine protein kinase/ankyrin repeat protein